ncbi:uncharacterized protein [Cicer arietinum]|uniref:Vegetative cell wall protein gp1-like n=1 Tax=Cicer arietinum TaxID=3827 RepID=A0A1S2XN79_CICAR|nr:vegetative cell wall protein gp1-like [Cicer arietinum]
MSWFLVILFLIVTFGSFSEASHDKKPLPSAVVVGTVYCDTCFQQDFSMDSHFISGASVEVECKDGNKISKPTRRFKKQVKTNKHGEFRVQLPFSVSKHVKKIKGCVVKLISSNEPYCAVASTATSSSLHLKSKKQGLHIFSAGFFSFKPLKQPNLCNQKPKNKNHHLFDSLKTSSYIPNYIDPSFQPPLQDPITPPSLGDVLPLLPPLLPLLPKLPPLQIPILTPPIPREKINDQYSTLSQSTKNPKKVEKVDNIETFNIPPNPLFPPPLVPNNPLLQPPSSPLIPPNPFQPPTPPPSFFPPNPLQPPPSRSSSPLFPFPSVPGFGPSPSPPSPPPSLSFPFPPIFPPPGTTPPSSKKASP